MTRKSLGLVASVGLLTLLYGASPASAQITPPTIVINYTFTVPFAQVVPHPCQSGFELITGTMQVAIATLQSTDFTLQLQITSAGRGDDVDATGLLLPTGAPYYEYSSSVTADAKFPDGKPSYFAHPLTVTNHLTRIGSTTDSFIMTTVFDVAYNNGIPTTPTLQTIDIRCK